MMRKSTLSLQFRPSWLPGSLEDRGTLNPKPSTHDVFQEQSSVPVLLQVDIQKVWLLFSSVVLAFAFIFGNSIRQLYEAVIFLFVIHPYDVGDWLKIGTNQYQVSSPMSSVVGRRLSQQLPLNRLQRCCVVLDESAPERL